MTPEEFEEKYMKMTFLDDYMMRRMFSYAGKEKLFEKIVSIILDRTDIHINSVETQKQMFANNKTIILDAFGEDSNGKAYDIEIQKYNEKDIGLRARAYGDIIDAKYLTDDPDYNHLPDRYLIFICDDDPFRSDENGRLIRTLLSLDEDGIWMNDRTYTIFVNCSYNGPGRDELLSLIHDMNCPTAADLKIPEIKTIMEVLKSKEEIMAYTNIMKETLEECRKEGIKEGIEEGKTQSRKEIALNLLRDGMTEEKVSEMAGLTLDEIRKLIDSIHQSR